MNWRERHPGTVIWATVAFVGAATVIVTSVGPVARTVWVSAIALFWIVTIAAGLCVLAALWVLRVAHRDDRAEIGILGSSLLVVSVLPLVHGLTAPGVVYGANSAVVASVYLSLPIACITAFPLLADGSAAARFVGRHWRWWSGISATVTTTIAAALLIWPTAVSVPGRGHPLTLLLWIGSLSCMFALSLRQLRLYWIGRRFATLASALAFVLLGLTSLVWMGDRPFSIGWWVVHALDIAGVLAGCFSLAFGYRLRAGIGEVLGPLLRRDPLVAFEFGLTPVVHQFVAALDSKDSITRDHVVRVTELALRVGERMRLSPSDLREVALGALLHDIGKLVVPDEILKKPGRLTESEFDVIRQHTIDGDALLRAAPSLVSAAPIVRSHHERLDGRGYPDRLSGDDIPLGARIVSVCDAYDAMANTRQYRLALGNDAAFAVLREHAGAQWDSAVVGHLLDLMTQPDKVVVGTLDNVGRTVGPVMDHLCECLDSLPDPVRERLTASAHRL
ncbi:MAG: HD-GYP domain-containing protein [Acidimicrobiales bacterium]